MPGLAPEDPRFELAVTAGLRLFVRNRFLNREDLEDLAQEIRIALWDHGGQAPQMCAKFAALDWFRKLWGRKNEAGEYRRNTYRGSRRHELLMRFGPTSVVSDTTEVDTPLGLAESREPSPDAVVVIRQIDAVLQRMEPRGRAILVMRHMMEMTQKEIGEELGLTEGRISQLLPAMERRFRVLASLPPHRRAA